MCAAAACIVSVSDRDIVTFDFIVISGYRHFRFYRHIGVSSLSILKTKRDIVTFDLIDISGYRHFRCYRQIGISSLSVLSSSGKRVEVSSQCVSNFTFLDRAVVEASSTGPDGALVYRDHVICGS